MDLKTLDPLLASNKYLMISKELERCYKAKDRYNSTVDKIIKRNKIINHIF